LKILGRALAESEAGGVVIVLLLPIFVTTYSGKESREFLEILKEKHPVQDLGLNDATTAG